MRSLSQKNEAQNSEDDLRIWSSSANLAILNDIPEVLNQNIENWSPTRHLKGPILGAKVRTKRGKFEYSNSRT